MIYKKDWFVALLLILTGGMIYVLYRPENLLLFRVTDSLGITPLIDILRSNSSRVMLPSFIVNSLPAGLWTASYLLMMYITTKFHTRRIRLMLALSLPITAIVLKFIALQILSVDSPHKSVSRISSCNGTRRTAGHVHPEVRI